MGRNIEYCAADGTTCIGYLATPERPSGAAVLIAHNAPGVDDHERGVADRLADLGYVALAADYQGGGEVVIDERLRQRLADHSADPARLNQLMRGAMDVLLARKDVDPARVAAIGYCFGGRAVLELARTGARLAAVVGFHASLPAERPDLCRNISARVLICNATIDPYVPPEQRHTFEQAMDAAGIDWRMVLYGNTQHAFTVANAERFGMPGIAYHPLNDRRSWAAMRELFAETIDQG